MNNKQKQEALKMLDNQKVEVLDLELKARYWKAQHDIRFYTLEAEKLQAPYNEYLTIQKEAAEKANAEFQQMLEKMKEQGAEVTAPVEPVTENLN